MAGSMVCSTLVLSHDPASIELNYCMLVNIITLFTQPATTIAVLASMFWSESTYLLPGWIRWYLYQSLCTAALRSLGTWPCVRMLFIGVVRAMTRWQILSSVWVVGECGTLYKSNASLYSIDQIGSGSWWNVAPNGSQDDSTDGNADQYWWWSESKYLGVFGALRSFPFRRRGHNKMGRF